MTSLMFYKILETSPDKKNNVNLDIYGWLPLGDNNKKSDYNKISYRALMITGMYGGTLVITATEQTKNIKKKKSN